jgi:uncharacterized protein involved in exopolysaccharide biosynthesis
MAANPYDLTTREVLSILFKERRKLIGTFLGLTVLVIGYSYLLTPYYEATASLLVKTGREFQVRSDPNAPIASVPSVTKQEVVNSEIQILTSRDLIQAVINRVGGAKLYPGAGNWSDPHSPAMDSAVRQFYSSFKVVPVEQSDVIDLSFRNPNRTLAVQALNQVVELYQQKHAAMFSDPRYQFLRQQTGQYEDRLAAQAKAVAAFKTAHSLFDADAQRARLLDDRASLSSILQQLQSQSIDAHRRIEFLQARLKATPPLISAGVTTSDVVEQAKDRLLDLQVKAQQLRERYVGDVKPLQDTEQEMTKLQEFISRPDPMKQKGWSQRNAAYDDMVVALNRALADAAPLDQQVALRTDEIKRIDTRLQELTDGAQQLDTLEREQRELQQLAHDYRSRYEEARMTEDLDREGVVSVSVVQQPDAPMRPSGPSHMPYGLAGVLIGLIGAGGFLVYLLVFRETLITVESVERLLGLPVLASVPSRTP